MSLDKSIEHRKEHRKQYQDGRRYLISIWNHKADSQAKHKRDVKLKKNKGMYIL